MINTYIDFMVLVGNILRLWTAFTQNSLTFSAVISFFPSIEIFTYGYTWFSVHFLSTRKVLPKGFIVINNVHRYYWKTPLLSTSYFEFRNLLLSWIFLITYNFFVDFYKSMNGAWVIHTFPYFIMGCCWNVSVAVFLLERFKWNTNKPWKINLTVHSWKLYLTLLWLRF